MAPRTTPGVTRERVFRYVRTRLLEGKPPTVREVQEAFGFRAVQSARNHLEKLVEEGRLVKQPGKARGYALPGPKRGLRGSVPPVMVPLIGHVEAGALVEAIEDPDGYLPVTPRGRSDTLFALRVRGESMIGAGILPGDVVVVRKQATAHTGDIVVALVEGEATVKRLRFRGKRIELRPENPAFDPIVPDPAACTILGKVIEVRRALDATRRRRR